MLGITNYQNQKQPQFGMAFRVGILKRNKTATDTLEKFAEHAKLPFTQEKPGSVFKTFLIGNNFAPSLEETAIKGTLELDERAIRELQKLRRRPEAWTGEKPPWVFLIQPDATNLKDTLAAVRKESLIKNAAEKVRNPDDL